MPNAQRNQAGPMPTPSNMDTTPLSFSCTVNAIIFRLLELHPTRNSPEYARAELERPIVQCSMTDVLLILYTIAEKIKPEYVEIMIEAAVARVDREAMLIRPHSPAQYEDKATSTK